MFSTFSALKTDYRFTRFGCYLGYITQAVVNNFLPLLFVTFSRSYGLSYARLSLLIAVNFVTQLTVDFISPPFVSRLGYRRTMLGGCLFSASGLALLSVLPEVLPHFAGLCCCMMLCAVGGGIMEVLVSPIVEGCPSDNKVGQMSLLHSFYCWGSAGCVLISTLYLTAAGTESWRLLAVLWAAVPLWCLFMFIFVPINEPEEEQKSGGSAALFKNRLFWLLAVMMICAGASELAVSQWASAFAETALGVSKRVGDIAGPFAFAILMGTARALCGRVTERGLRRCMVLCSALCVVGYAMISLSGSSAVSLAGCGVCGFAVGIMWPGTFSIAAARIPKGGTAMFALFALAGDLGCTAGPAVVGLSSDLEKGFMYAMIFPVLMLVCLASGGGIAPPDRSQTGEQNEEHTR